MRVLLIHNFYRSAAPSGEDNVYRQELALLRAHGVEVATLERHNDALDDAGAVQLAATAAGTVWSARGYADVARLVARFRPDVVHVHNTFPQLSPSVYTACRDHGVPVVQTLHNFRTICAGALLMREDKPCEDCLGGSLVPALRHRCYRGSLPATAAVTAMIGWHRLAGTFRHSVDRYIALTRFAAEKFVQGGLPRERIRVRPNFIADPGPPGDGGGEYVLFVGRLSPEKGLRALLSAWAESRDLPTLRIVGDGALRDELVARIEREALRIEYIGPCARDGVIEHMRGARALVVPSECYEGFPLVVAEAYAVGTPVVASDLGGLRELVEEGCTGVRFTPGIPLAIARAVHSIAASKECGASLRASTRARFLERYTAEAAFRSLMGIYREVASARGNVGAKVSISQ